jgi:NADH-quinone oxidoreductase subunit C/D
MPWAKEEDFLELKKKFKNLQIEVKPTITNLHTPKHELIELLRELKQMGYRLFIDHSVVDFPERSPRFQAFYILYNVDERKRIVVKTWTDGTLPSIEKLWFAGKWAERECYDMFGIQYEGHENLVRAFMWETYQYHPLRKDFPLEGYANEYLPSLNEVMWGENLQGLMNYDRMHTPVPTLEDMEITEKRRLKKKAQLVLNWGPLHPGTHGTMWFLFDLEGERVVQCDVILGQLHRGVEKLAENEMYNQFFGLYGPDGLHLCPMFQPSLGGGGGKAFGYRGLGAREGKIHTHHDVRTAEDQLPPSLAWDLRLGYWSPNHILVCLQGKGKAHGHYRGHNRCKAYHKLPKGRGC